MNVIKFVREGLGNSSYMVEVGDGEAALIDPDRSTDRYREAAQMKGLRISHVLETHLHADLVSGVREVSQATGAQVHLPEGAQAGFPHNPLVTGRRLQMRGVQVEAIASPGHTPEHLSYVFRAERQTPTLFSGGALIVGGAARTDLISPEMTPSLTRAQYTTLKTAFSSLGDETSMFPTHGGGSFCSAGVGGKRTSTLGEERAQNPVLSMEDEEEFVRWFPSTFPPGVPEYFFRMRPINKAGPRLRAEIQPPPRLSPADFDAARLSRANGGAQPLVMDVRPFESYAEIHIPGSVSNPFRDAYATFLGWVVSPESPLLFVTGDAPLEHVIDESLLVGHERFGGWLDGGIEAWIAADLAVQSIAVVDALRARKALLDGAAILDVRERDEFESGHVDGAINVPVGTIGANMDRIPKDRPVLAYCGHGERSSTALSLLERAGVWPLMNLSGGMGAWKDAGYKVA